MGKIGSKIVENHQTSFLDAPIYILCRTQLSKDTRISGKSSPFLMPCFKQLIPSMILNLYSYSHLGPRGTTPKKARNKAPTEPQQNNAARKIKPPEKAK